MEKQKLTASVEATQKDSSEKEPTLKFKPIKETVLENQEKLKSFTTPKEFFMFAIEHNLDDRIRFPHFKKALLKHLNIDYVALKNEKKDKFQNELKQQITQEISLTTDAWGKKARYAVVLTETGKPISFGKFYEKWELEQSRAELEAAKYAVGIVAKMMKDNNIQALKLNLTVDAQWLLHQENYKQTGYELKDLANSKKIFLNTIWQPGRDNLADRYSRSKEFQKTDYELLKKSLKPAKWEEIKTNEVLEEQEKKSENKIKQGI